MAAATTILRNSLLQPIEVKTSPETRSLEKIKAEIIERKMHGTERTPMQLICKEKRNWKRLLEYSAVPCRAFSLSVLTGVHGATITLNFKTLGLEKSITDALDRAKVRGSLPAISCVTEAGKRLQHKRKQLLKNVKAAWDGVYFIIPEADYKPIFLPALAELEAFAEEQREQVKQEYELDLHRIINRIEDIAIAARLSPEQSEALLLAVEAKIPGYKEVAGGITIHCYTKKIQSIKETMAEDAELLAINNKLNQEKLTADLIQLEKQEKKKIIQAEMLQFQEAVSQAKTQVSLLILEEMSSLLDRIQDIPFNTISRTSRVSLRRVEEMLSLLAEEDSPLSELNVQIKSIQEQFGSCKKNHPDYQKKLEEFSEKLESLKMRIGQEIDKVQASNSGEVSPEQASFYHLKNSFDFSLFNSSEEDY